MGSKVVEEIGFEKIRKQQSIIQELRVVILDGLRVAGVCSSPKSGPSIDRLAELQRIKDSCVRLTDLDLSYSLIEPWSEVIAICEQIPSLKALKVGWVKSSVLDRYSLILTNAADRTGFESSKNLAHKKAVKASRADRYCGNCHLMTVC